MTETLKLALLMLFVGLRWMIWRAEPVDGLGRVEGKALALLRCDADGMDQT